VKILELERVSKRFVKPVDLAERIAGYRPEVVQAVDGVSFSVSQGEVVGLVGESGCGKSTLARMILGLEPPSAGKILFDGKPLSSFPRRELARRVQPIFQDPYSSLNPRKTVGAIVSLPLQVHRIGTAREREQWTRDMLERVGLPGRYYRSYPGQLSGGQRQRVAIARALGIRPELVICDEPTSALDVSVQSQILNLLQSLQKDFGLTYLLISHNLAVVHHMADRVGVMYLGRIVEEAPAASLFAQPRHPYTEALLKSALTPEPGLGLPDTQLGAGFPNPLEPPSGCTFHPRCPHAFGPCAAVAPKPIADRREKEGGHVKCHLYDHELREAAQ
jgi:peptide/nickel transport system ATP-binding protein